MTDTRVAGPPWMPPAGTIALLPAAEWWDAVVVPELRGLDALAILDHVTDRAPGPVIWEPLALVPRLYFLVPKGTADGWDLPGTISLGAACFIGIPGTGVIEPPSVHWLVPPDPDDPEGLVNPDALRAALLAALEAGAA